MYTLYVYNDDARVRSLIDFKSRGGFYTRARPTYTDTRYAHFAFCDAVHVSVWESDGYRSDAG